MKINLEETIALPSGVTATLANGTLTIKGPKGEITRNLKDPLITIQTKDNTITIKRKKGTKRHKRIINSFAAHINNMIQGAQQPYQYILKILAL